MNILIAPDKFKDALDAPGVAAALAEGVCDAIPSAHIECQPLGDGGEGTGRLLGESIGADERMCEVLDPLGRPRTARWWQDRDNRVGVIEMAEASGLCLLQNNERDATRTTSFGTGQLIRAAIDAGCREVMLCVGGSATVDGGAGCLQALGWRVIGADGVELATPLSGGALDRISELVPPTNEARIDITIMCDVTNPLLGDNGSAVVFAPQKGASPQQVTQLEENLRHWADVLQHATGRDVRDLPGAGAAGGLPAGLAAAFDATPVSGFDDVARRLRLREAIARCDLVLTGEGRLDEQTVGGKVVVGVARLAGELGKPVVAFVGAVQTEAGEDVARLAKRVGLREIVVITPRGTPIDVALAETRNNLRNAVSKYLITEK